MTATSEQAPVGLSLHTCIKRAQSTAPALRRRLAAFLYEGVLLFGLLMVVGGIYSVITNQRHGMHGREGMMATIFLALSLYFMWFWTHGGQTLAMRTWHLRLVSAQGLPLSLGQALKRYLLSWLWLMPPWIGAWMAGWHQSKWVYGAMLIWMLIFSLLTRLLPQNQFLHDAICGTRLIDTRPDLASTAP